MTPEAKNKLYITEIINDLERNGYEQGGKAQTMLHDWARELREAARTDYPVTRLRKYHAAHCGRESW